MDNTPEDIRQAIERLRQENAQFRTLLGIPTVPPKAITESVSQDQIVFPEPSLPIVTNQSAAQDKIALFRTLFRGRDDVYAQFWINERTGAGLLSGLSRAVVFDERPPPDVSA
jgi:hypothetical protein